MNKTTMSSATKMLENEIDKLEEELDAAIKNLGKCLLDENTEWSLKYQCKMECKVIEGKIFVLQKMLKLLADQSIDLPQLTA